MMEPYAKYKNSGIEWLGKIPEHWNLLRINDIAIQRKIKNTALSENNLLSLSYGKIKRKDIDSHFGLLPESFETYQIIEKGNIILRLTDLQNDKKSLRVGLVNERGIITSAYLCLQLLKSNFPTFAYYLLYSFDISKVFYWFGGGLRQSMKFDDVKVIPFVLPPVPEQEAIAHYLDTKTAQIDGKIDLLTQKAQRYEELKRSLINETVTRGLDKSVSMKDSGIEWIGDIPKHWQVERINDIAVQQKRKNIGLKEKNLLSLSYGKIKRRDFDTSFGLLPESFETYQIVDTGNIILRLTDLQNDQRSLRVGLVGERGIITSAYLCLILFRRVYSNFAYYLLYVYDISKVFYWFGGGLRQSMKFDDIKIFPFLLPPLYEQKEIARYLDTKTAQIDQIIQTINTQIEKLKELRKTLINDVVTGKIKVI